MAEQQPATPYTRIFETLATPEEGVAGMIAYALYKENKRAWIQQFQRQRGRRPTDEEVRNWVDSITPLDIERYRQQARTWLNAFAAGVLQENIAEIERQARDESILGEVQAIRADIQRQSGFWRSVLVNGTSTFVAAFIAFMLFVVTFAIPGVEQFFKRLNPLE